MGRKTYQGIVLLTVFFWVFSLAFASAAVQEDKLEQDKTAIQIDDMPTVVRVEWEPVTPIIIHPQLIPLLFGPNDYMLYNVHGGWWYDAEKTVDNWDDDLMCWAASCANALEWTGWGIVTDTANGDLTDTDDMLDNFNHYYVDRGGYMSYGWNWWFDGEDPDPGEGRLSITDSGGGYWPTEDIADYYFEEWDKDEVLVRIDEYLHEGYSTTIGIRPVSGSGGHAITVWGFRFDTSQYSNRFDDPDSYYLGLYVTDSDDDKAYTTAAPPPNTLRFYNSTYDDTNDRWVLSYGSGSGWYIDAVMALAPPDPAVYGSRPVASFDPVDANIGISVILDGSDSSDPDGDTLQYRWDFDDDGFWDTAWSFSPTVSHTWEDEYDGNVLLEVFDGRYKDVHRVAVDISGIRLVTVFEWRPVLRDQTYEIKFADISVFQSKDVVEWDWDFGGKDASTEKEPVLPKGTYDVRLTLRYRDGTTETFTKSIDNTDPKANFTWSPEIQIEGGAVQFKDLSSSLSGKIRTWLWDFGDGSTSKEQNPKHVYTDDGTYDVSLTVTNEDGSKDTLVQSVTIRDLSPVAAFTYNPKPQYVGEPVSFIDLSASQPDNIVSWSWNFGDGSTSDEQDPEHTYSEDGVYEVRLTVTDEDGSYDVISYRVIIEEAPSKEKPSILYSHGDPTNTEQYILELINRARADPFAEGKRLGIDIEAGIQSKVTPQPPLALNEILLRVARAHCTDMKLYGFSNTNSEGLVYGDRMKNAGYTGKPSGENIATGGSADRLYGIFMREVSLSFDLNHREVLLGIKYPQNEVGIGYLEETGKYASFMTIDYGYRPEWAFIVGVVYSDMDSDGFYDPGEGLSGVTVMPSMGSYYAVTSASGGYAIPITTNGKLMVTASGGELKSPIAKTVEAQVPGDNIKLDFVVTSTPVEEYYLQIQVEGNGKTDPASGEVHTYEAGSGILLSAYPADGWEFSHWSIGVESENENPLKLILDEDIKATAVFVESQVVTYTVAIEVEGSGTTDPAPGNYDMEENEQLTVEAKPEEGWVFSEWLLNGGSAGDDNPITQEVTQDMKLIALFLEEPEDQLIDEEKTDSNPLSNLINAIMEFLESLFSIFG